MDHKQSGCTASTFMMIVGFILCAGFAALVFWVASDLGGSGDLIKPLGFIFIFVALYFLIKLIVGFSSTKTPKIVAMDWWLNTKSHCQYKYAYDNSGIALDIYRKILHVAGLQSQGQEYYASGQIFVERSYPFSDIRSLEGIIPGVRNAIYYGNAADHFDIERKNRLAQLEAEAGTGLLVEVKDIQCPIWFIRFYRSQNTDRELRQWREIFAQYVNDDRPQQRPLTDNPKNDHKYCTNCGTQIANNAQFCMQCGTPQKNKV